MISKLNTWNDYPKVLLAPDDDVIDGEKSETILAVVSETYLIRFTIDWLRKSSSGKLTKRDWSLVHKFEHEISSDIHRVALMLDTTYFIELKIK